MSRRLLQCLRYMLTHLSFFLEMPTGSERLVWAQGSPSTLRAVTTSIKGVRICMAAAICWENMMPLLRYALYSQNVNLWLAPTADARETWWPLMRTVGSEGRCFVLSAITCVRKTNLPGWVTGVKTDAATSDDASMVNGAPSPPLTSDRSRRRSTVTFTEEKHELVLPSTDEVSEPSSLANTADAGSKVRTKALPTSEDKTVNSEDFACRGGSCIVGPFGNAIDGPLWEVEDGGLLITEADFEDCERGRLDLDVAGSYSRNDAFKLTVEGLDINPPP